VHKRAISGLIILSLFLISNFFSDTALIGSASAQIGSALAQTNSSQPTITNSANTAAANNATAAASNATVAASNATAAASNATVAASNATVAASNATVAASNATVAASNATVAATAAAAAANNATAAANNATAAANNATVAATNVTAAASNVTAAASNVTAAANNAAAAVNNATAAAADGDSVNQTQVNQTQLVDYIFQNNLPVYFIIVIFLVITIPLVLDIILAYRRKPIESKSNNQSVRVSGMPGLYRSLMTFGFIVLLGTVIFYLLALITLNMNNPSSPAFESLVDLLRNLGIILGTGLATIIAFYFGVRGSESAVEKASNAIVAGLASTEAADVEGPPKVLNTRPADGAKDVPTNTLISATFSEPINSGTINSTTYSVRKDGGDLIAGKISLSPDPKTAQFDPDEPLDPGTTYIAEISEKVKDLAGNAVGSITRWSFTTAARGEVEGEGPITKTIAGPRDGLTVEKVLAEINKSPLVTVSKSGSGKEYKGKSNVVIEGFDFTVDDPDGKMLKVEDCVDVVIRRCKFRKKTTKGQGIDVVGDKTRRVIVEYCLFEEFSFTSGNGGEPFRFGLSQFSGVPFESILRKSVFRKCNSDPEAASLKSCNNTIEDCFLLDSDANFTIRHGGYNRVVHNYFKGNNGVRVHGYGNEVAFNCFEDNTDTGKRAPIGLWYGEAEKDPNWTDQKTPSGKEGSSHAIYARTVNNNVHDNEFKNCKATVVEVTGKSLAPKDNTLNNNKKVDRFTFETQEQSRLTSTTTPKVLNTRPADGAKDVPTNTLISATFSEPMNSEIIDNTTYSVRKDGGSLIKGKISLSPDPKTAEFNPDQDLDPGTTYIAEISEKVKDLAGNAVGSITRWSFTTAAGTTTDTTTKETIAGPRDGITAEKIEQEINSKNLTPVTKEGKSFSGKKKITIEGFDFTVNKTEQKQLAVTDCEDLIIQYCKFRDKTTLGQGLNITGAKTKRVIVQYCIFENFSFTESNGGEPLRLGNSQFSGCNFECIVRWCIFRNLKSDPEAISIKSCGNVIEDCFFFDNESNVTVRHGGYATVQHCYFQKKGGVRVHGYGNKVRYNCFEDFNTDEGFAPIIERYGLKEKDPNWNDVKTPSGKEGESHAIYAQTVDLEIEGNEFKNCKKTIITLKKGDATLPPKNTKSDNNKTITKFTFET
jgi:Bacterial Ig-like domain/Chondroitinase B